MESPAFPVKNLACILAIAHLMMTGCVSIPILGGDSPTGPVRQIATTWSNQVKFTPDPTRGGAQTPGMAGRLYLLDARGLPVVGDGALSVELYDDSPKAKGGEPSLLELWNFNKETLRQLASRDTIGWGYTLFLPWGTYSPAIRAVHMKVCYAPPKSIPLYDQSGTVTLNSADNSKTRSEIRSVTPTTENRDSHNQH